MARAAMFTGPGYEIGQATAEWKAKQEQEVQDDTSDRPL
jgi:hypothetical protein